MSRIRFILLQGFVFVFVFISSLAIKAQNVVYKNFTTKEGLFSSQVYDMHQDKRGNIWFATDNGISTYDGNEFRTYSTKDGLCSNTLFRIYEDYDGRLWFNTFYNGINYYENNQFYTIKPTPHIDSFFRQEVSINLGFRKNEGIYYVSYQGDRIYKGEPDTNTNGEIRLDSSTILILDASIITEKVFFENINGRIQASEKELKFFIQNVKKKLPLTYTGKIKSIRIRYYVKKDGTKLIIYKGKLYKADGKEIILVKEYSTAIHSILEDRAGNIWLGLLNGGGILFYPEGDFTQTPIKILDNLSTTDVIQDRENHVWIATLDNGVYMVPNAEIRYFKEKENETSKIMCIAGSDRVLLCGTSTGKLFSIDSSTLKLTNRVRSPRNVEIYNIAYMGDGKAYLSMGYVYDFKRNTNKFYAITLGAKALLKLRNSDILLGLSNGLSFFDSKKGDVYKTIKDNRFKRVFSLHEDNKGDIWVGTLNGIFRYRDDNIESLSNLDPLFGSRVTSISEDEKNNLLFFSIKGEGILVWKKNRIRQITKEDGLNSNQVKKVYIENDSTLWVGSNKGLNKIIYEYIDEQLIIRSITGITTDHGLPSEAINDIKKAMGKIWLATDNGVVYFPSTAVSLDSITPIVEIKGLRLQGKDSLIQTNGVSLSSNQNSISIDYKSTYFNTTQNIIYRYKLEGLDQEWVETINKSVQYTNLPYGDYTFKLLSKNKDNIWNHAPQEFNFTIQQHFTEKLYFRILCLIFLIFIFYFLFKYFLRRQQKREAVARRTLDAELKGLRRQMNPHFMYNAMNSIQYFITVNDKKNAAIYLALFSSLMRNILENSKREFIPLHDELETLNTYLKLEKLRFSDLFEYEIKVSAEINKYEWLIPPSLIQPFVENAVLHGVRHRKKDGSITIEFLKKDSQMDCIIEDNGVGRKKAAELNQKRRRKKHKSTGVQNSKDRINLLNSIHKTKMKLEIIDKFENGVAQGTKIVISMPPFRIKETMKEVVL